MGDEPAPFLLLQISDLHIGASWNDADPDECLLRAVEAILSLPDRPDALLVSGDLTDNGAPEEYRRARELLAPLDLTPHVLPGNHDLRAPLREAFGLPGRGEDPVSYAVDLGPLRLVCLDSTVPGAEGGSLDGGRVEWLEATLAEDPTKPTVLARHPQVTRIVAGHVHRSIVAELAGSAVVTVPSTYLQTALDFTAPKLTMRADPPGFAVHALRGDSLATHLQRIPGLPD